MTENELNEALAIYEEAYRDVYRATGKKNKARTAARKTITACYPGVAVLYAFSGPRSDKTHATPEQLDLAAALIAGTGAAARRVASTVPPNATRRAAEPVPASATNGNGNHNGAPRTRSTVSAPLLKMLAATKLRAGDVWPLGNLDALTAILECGETSIQSALVSERQGPIQQAGWRFEGMNAPRHDYRVKCVQAPLSEAESLREKIEKRIAEWAERQERERDDMAARHVRELDALRAELGI